MNKQYYYLLVILFSFLFLAAQAHSNDLGGPNEIAVKVFFNNNRLDPQVSCIKVFPVKRIVKKTQGLGITALQELLKGPTNEEKAAGYYTNINNNVRINKLRIKDGVAWVDFGKTLEEQVAGSCRVRAIRAQIERTLKQFSTVKEVIISINGQTENILQP